MKFDKLFRRLHKENPSNGGGSSRLGWWLCGGMSLLFLCFDIIWCSGTTFRAMSDWKLYAFNLTAALLLTLPAVLLRRIWIQTVLMICVAILFEANLMYCRTYLTAIPADAYVLASNLADFTASVRDSLRWGDIALGAIILATALGPRLFFRKGHLKWGRPLPYLCACAGGVLLCGIGVATKGGFYKEYDRLAQSCYYSTCGTPIYTIAGTLAYEAMNTPEQLTPEVKAQIDNWKRNKDELRPFRALTPKDKARRNLVIILLESFESWPLEARICNGGEITPFLNSLIADSTTLFRPNMLTQVASGRSIDCQLLLTCGLLPMENSVWSMSRPQAAYPSLVKAMQEDRNVRSAIFTCDKPITWNQEVVARTLGYDTLLHRGNWKIDELVGNPAKLSDGSFLRQSVAKLKENSLGIDGHPFFLTFVTYSGHNPFQLPANLRDHAFNADGCGYPERMKDYITMAHYTDASLRVLINYLKERPDWDETLVVITGDHEGLAADRRDILKSPKAKGLVSDGQFTPFIVLNTPRGGRSEDVMGQIDIYPTLLDMLGLHNYHWKGMGQNIQDPMRIKAALSSMTGELAGDTLGIGAERWLNLKQSRRISDKMIRLTL